MNVDNSVACMFCLRVAHKDQQTCVAKMDEHRLVCPARPQVPAAASAVAVTEQLQPPSPSPEPPALQPSATGSVQPRQQEQALCGHPQMAPYLVHQLGNGNKELAESRLRLLLPLEDAFHANSELERQCTGCHHTVGACAFQLDPNSNALLCQECGEGLGLTVEQGVAGKEGGEGKVLRTWSLRYGCICNQLAASQAPHDACFLTSFTVATTVLRNTP